ncbi:MAG: sigma-70 family RNA polymerase sigma factor [Thermoleophilia bacterium]
MTDDHPTPEQRRQAVAHALANAPQLLRYAVRFTRNLADAEDAYQRAMVIALERTPVVEHERFLAWLRTVIRNEALAMRGRNQREEATADAALELLPDHDARTPSPLARLQWRERYLIIDEALTGLTPAQRVCLMLQVAGASCRAPSRSSRVPAPQGGSAWCWRAGRALVRMESAIGRGDACAALEPALGARGRRGAPIRRAAPWRSMSGTAGCAAPRCGTGRR